MGVFAQSLRLSLAVSAVALVAGCNQPKWRDGAKPADKAAATAPAAPKGPRESTEAVPAAPAWAAAVIGKPLRSVFTGDGACIGNTDNVEVRYVGAAPGVKVIGWGWEPAAKAAVQRVVLVNSDFMIVGAGDTGLERLDVPAAKPEITSTNTGWGATTTQTKASLDTYGVLADGKSVCRLGHVDF